MRRQMSAMVTLLCAASVILAGCTPTPAPAPTTTTTTAPTTTTTTTTTPSNDVAHVTISASVVCASAAVPGTQGVSLCQYSGDTAALLQIYPQETGGLAGCATYGELPILDVAGLVTQNGVTVALGRPTSYVRGQWWYQLPQSSVDGPITVTISQLSVGSSSVCAPV